MKLEFQKVHKVIPAGGSTKLNKFSVITGLNGAGKTQLLQAIVAKKVIVFEPNQSAGILHLAGLHIQGDERLVRPEDASALFDEVCNAVDSAANNPNVLDMTREKYIGRGFPSQPSIPRISDQQQYGSPWPRIQKAGSTLLRRALEHSFDAGKKPLSKLEVRNLATLEELSLLDSEGVLQTRVSGAFLRYLQLDRDHKFSKYLRDVEGDRSVTVLTDEEFKSIHGTPPWEALNSTLDLMGLPYEVNRPTSADNAFQARLTHKSLNHVIGFNELSSGEQALCRLAMSLYSIEAGAVLPKLILLDEPDAHLHPQMSEKLIRTLTDVILPQVEQGIVITTHSPTTCALSPPDSLYLMDVKTRRPTKTTLDEALEVLCAGLPTLSIRKENERQVFVESNVDAEIYSRLWARLKDVHLPQNVGPSLNFISSGRGAKSGNCSEAVDLCRSLRKAGSTTAYAFIDYDTKHTSSHDIVVLGENAGYSLENFVLHPIAILALLHHRYGYTDGLPKFAESLDYISIGKIGVEALQEVTDQFCQHLKNSISSMRNSKDVSQKFIKIDLNLNKKLNFYLADGQTMKLPKWYLMSQGHEIEAALVKTFPGLLKYGREAGALPKAITQFVFSSHTALVPKEIVDCFQKLRL